MSNEDLKAAFSNYNPTDASIVLDRISQKPRGFGFVWFKVSGVQARRAFFAPCLLHGACFDLPSGATLMQDKLGMEDAIRDMHNKVRLLGLRDPLRPWSSFSCLKAHPIPTKPLRSSTAAKYRVSALCR